LTAGAPRARAQTLRRVHDEMERVHNVRIKPARDGARPRPRARALLQPCARAQGAMHRTFWQAGRACAHFLTRIVLCRAVRAAHELAYDALRVPTKKLHALLEKSEEEQAKQSSQRKARKRK
jgi:hypothetical protein